METATATATATATITDAHTDATDDDQTHTAHKSGHTPASGAGARFLAGIGWPLWALAWVVSLSAVLDSTLHGGGAVSDPLFRSGAWTLNLSLAAGLVGGFAAREAPRLGRTMVGLQYAMLCAGTGMLVASA
ncbi:hypothetical protein [Streptomyces sp. KLOTTS4A1]|uniref:hypothetical protein n=1 Tax=Streptomyces sp. KLOTTS4A1 TaxID=3390996 RepID=UPI0039F4CEA2